MIKTELKVSKVILRKIGRRRQRKNDILGMLDEFKASPDHIWIVDWAASGYKNTSSCGCSILNSLRCYQEDFEGIALTTSGTKKSTGMVFLYKKGLT